MVQGLPFEMDLPVPTSPSLGNSSRDSCSRLDKQRQTLDRLYTISGELTGDIRLERPVRSLAVSEKVCLTAT